MFRHKRFIRSIATTTKARYTPFTKAYLLSSETSHCQILYLLKLEMLRHLYITLLFWVLLSPSEAVDVSNLKTFAKNRACNYLTTDGKQNNSYTFEGRECCMCPKGKRFVDHCNVFDPTSTICELCDENKHIEFEPHLETKCIAKRFHLCHPPEEYHEGSQTEADGCRKKTEVLKTPGESERSTLRTTVEHERTDLLSTTSSTQPNSITRGTKPIISRITDTKATKEKQATSSTNQNYKSNNTPHSQNGQTAVIISVSVTAVVALGLIVVLYRYFKRRKNIRKDYIPPTSTSTPSKNRSRSSPPVNESRVTFSTNTDSMLSDGESNASIAPSFQENNAQAKSNSRPADELTHVVVEQNQQSVPHQDASPRLRAATPPQPTLPVEDPVTVQLLLQIDQVDRLEDNSTRKRLALAFADKFGQRGPRTRIRPFMRELVGFNEETVFDDLDDAFRHDTREFSIRCMRHAIETKGKLLTAKYLYEKVKKLNMKMYEEILMEEINKSLNPDDRSRPE